MTRLMGTKVFNFSKLFIFKIIHYEKLHEKLHEKLYEKLHEKLHEKLYEELHEKSHEAMSFKEINSNDHKSLSKVD